METLVPVQPREHQPLLIGEVVLLHPRPSGQLAKRPFAGRWRRYASAAVLAAALGVVAGLPRLAWAVDDQAAATLASEVTSLERRLTRDQAMSQDQRDQVARQLIALPSAAVVPLARSILTDPSAANQPARLSVARAIADASEPSPELIVPLFAAMTPDAPRDLVDAVANALARYKGSPEVLLRLIDLSRPNNTDAIRIAATRALAGFPERAAAEQLVQLVADNNEPVAVIADNALIELTGIESPGPGGWPGWFADRASLSEQAFRDELSRSRLARLERNNREVDSMRQALTQFLLEQFEQTPPDQRTAVLRSYLRSGVDAMRLVGVQIIDTQAANIGSVAPELRAMLPDLLADPSIDVRMRTARALQTLNDATALDTLLRRLSLEPHGDVRVILCDAIARLQDVRAAPVLMRLLDDPSPAVAAAATRALGDLGPQLSSDAFLSNSENRALVDQLAWRLRERFERMDRPPTNAGGRAPGSAAGLPARNDQRQVLLDTLARLRQPQMLPFWKELLSANRQPPAPAGYRRAAVAAIGATGDPKAIDVVASSLNDSASEVRVEAVRNVALLSSDFAFGQALYRRSITREESDPRVQVAAWTALKSILHLAPRNQLSSWAEREDMLPERRLDVYRTLVTLAEKENDLDDAATRRQQVGDALFAQNRFTEAAAEYQRAMSHLQALPNPAVRLPRLLRLTESTLKSMIRSDQLPAAIELATSLYGDAEYRVSIGSVFRQEAERLAQNADQLDNAEAFIEKVLAMTPSLQDQQAFLQRMLADVRRRKQERNDMFLRPDHLSPQFDFAHRNAAPCVVFIRIA